MILVRCWDGFGIFYKEFLNIIEEIWKNKLPAGGYATPITYQIDGKQYVVIACGGGKMGTKSGNSYIAFALN